MYLINYDPKTYQKRLKLCGASSLGKEAINSVLNSLAMNQLWKLVDLSKWSKPIKYKWIFKKKTRTKYSIEKYKAKLVAVENTEKQGIDYFDTYSSITKIATIRTLIEVSIIHGLLIHQMDVKIAFLNGDLKEKNLYDRIEDFKFCGQKK